jgi:hypothetical protein
MSVIEIILIITCWLLLVALLIGLIYACIHSFQWFRKIIDAEAPNLLDAERAGSGSLTVGREMGIGNAWMARLYGDGASDDRDGG